jgi:hypothetical protein
VIDPDMNRLFALALVAVVLAATTSTAARSKKVTLTIHSMPEGALCESQVITLERPANAAGLDIDLHVAYQQAMLTQMRVQTNALDDDYFFGVLQSRVHELWAPSTGTQLREVESGFRYTPSTCFDTFPFPDGATDGQRTLSPALERPAHALAVPARVAG